MHTTPRTVYLILNQSAGSELLPENFLPSGWSIRAGLSRKEVREFYDTFEWQAFNEGIAVVKKRRTLLLADLNTGKETSSLPFAGSPSSFFSDTLPSSHLKAKLTALTNIRAFIKLCSIDAISTSYRILDDNQKTIATLTSEVLSLASKEKQEPFAHIFSLFPLKGFGDEMELLEKSLSSNHHEVRELCFRELFVLNMHAAGRNIQDYSSKIQLDLDSDAPVHNSVRQLLQSTFSVMCANEEGIKRQIDSEFLHDYRVAIRRTRSILKQLKGVFDPEETTYYLNFFRELGKQTSALRDQDVYLLRQATYFDYLPPFLQPSLRPFFTDIALSRKKLHKTLCRYLASSEYRSFLGEWDAFAHRQSTPDPERSPNASLSTGDVALHTIKKAWKKVIRHGRQISRETTDAELHALRIDCKKLRYLLEFFSSIFPHKSVAPVIGQLKELQDNLGDFVDYAVQLHFLRERLSALSPGKEELLLAASTGALIATLFQKQEEVRSKFHKTFASFDHEKTSELFDDLLNENPK
ncbi:MAG: CHAD domain-containing protein [Pelodictyon phaeoclathratiforme]